MLGWIVGLIIRRAVRRVNEGDAGAMLSSYSRDAVLVFPGDHSWAGEYRGRDRIGVFLRRCVESGLQFEIEDVMVSGWPWSAKVCIRLTDRAVAPDGAAFYANRAMIFARTSWGKIVFHEAYEDTQKVVMLDEYMASREAGAPA